MISQARTWIAAIADASRKLDQAGIADAKVNAEYLACNVLGFWNPSELRTSGDSFLTDEQNIQYDELISRRLSHEPLQHIIGETEFFGLRLLTSSSALIPRPDTEILVEAALKEASEMSRKHLQILDIGTGSGAIALAIASKLPVSFVTGIDSSFEAIGLAIRNKKKLNIENVSFEVMDIFHEDIAERFLESVDILVSNPPYISIEEFGNLEKEVRDFDPRIALTDEGDGLSFYRRISGIGRRLLKEKGRIIVEVGYNAILAVEKIFVNEGFTVIRKVKDLQGIERVLVTSCLSEN